MLLANHGAEPFPIARGALDGTARGEGGSGATGPSGPRESP